MIAFNLLYFIIKIDSNSSDHANIKTARSKSCSIHHENIAYRRSSDTAYQQQTTDNKSNMNTLLSPNSLSSCSFQSISSNDKAHNRLGAPDTAANESLNESLSSNCLNSSQGSASSRSMKMAHLHVSHSMYNFEASSFPEFNYFKTQHGPSVQNSQPAGDDDAFTVISFLKNFDSSFKNLNDHPEKLKIQNSAYMGSATTHKEDFTKDRAKLSRLKANDAKYSKSNFELNKKVKENPFLISAHSNIINNKPSKSASFLSKSLNVSNQLSETKSADLNETNEVNESAAKKTSKFHLFDFYSYYNNKYNQENQLKKNLRRTSESNTKPGRFNIRFSRASKEFSENCSENQSNSFADFYLNEENNSFNMKRFTSL